MYKKLVALLSLLALLISAFCACASPKKEEDTPRKPNTATSASKDQPTKATEAQPTKTPEIQPTKAPEEKPDSGVQVNDALRKLQHTDKTIYATSAYGAIYRENGLYGVLALDGKKDSGAIYYNANVLGKYFSVVTQKPLEPSNMEEINATGMVDGNGKILIPAEYALIKQIGSDRYFQVFKTTEITQDKDKSLIYLTSKMFSLEASEDDILYKGNWYIFDIETGKTVDGISPTVNYNSGVSGDKIYYYDEQKKSVTVNTLGKPFPANATVMDNGSYYVQEEYAVYDAFGKKLFSYADAKYDYIYYYEGYYLCKKYENGENISQILDQSGNVVSVAFNKSVQIIGKDMVLFDKAACDFQGKKHLDAVVDSIRRYDDLWYLSNYETKEYYLLDSNFQLLYSGSTASGPEFQSYNLGIVKQEGNDRFFYSFKQKDFVYKGNGVENGWVAIEDEKGLDTLVNTRNDEVLASGYRSYQAVKADDGKIYIYAQPENGGYDIFVME